MGAVCIGGGWERDEEIVDVVASDGSVVAFAAFSFVAFELMEHRSEDGFGAVDLVAIYVCVRDA